MGLTLFISPPDWLPTATIYTEILFKVVLNLITLTLTSNKFDVKFVWRNTLICMAFFFHKIQNFLTFHVKC